LRSVSTPRVGTPSRSSCIFSLRATPGPVLLVDLKRVFQQYRRKADIRPRYRRRVRVKKRHFDRAHRSVRLADILGDLRHVSNVPLPDASVRQSGYRPMSADREAALIARTINLDDVVKCTVVPRLSGNPHGSLETESGTSEGAAAFPPSRTSFDCPLREFKHGRFCGTRQDEG
jgi:hypothetical protein